MPETTIRSAYTEVVRHGSIVFTEKEAIDILLAAVDADPLNDRPAIAEGQLGWSVNAKYTIHHSDGEVFITVNVVWSKSDET